MLLNKPLIVCQTYIRVEVCVILTPEVTLNSYSTFRGHKKKPTNWDIRHGSECKNWVFHGYIESNTVFFLNEDCQLGSRSLTIQILFQRKCGWIQRMSNSFFSLNKAALCTCLQWSCSLQQKEAVCSKRLLGKHVCNCMTQRAGLKQFLAHTVNLLIAVPLSENA